MADSLERAYVFFSQHLGGTRDLVLGGCSSVSQHGAPVNTSDLNALQPVEDVRMMREIMLVPLPRAASRRLMSFLTFQISIYRIVSVDA